MSKPNRKVAVLVNCFNYEAFVGDAIRSVGAQEIRPDELIIVDDGSTDGSAKEIEKALAEIGFGRLVRQENGGQLSAFERGIEESTSEWVFFLDADDLYTPGHIATLMSCIEKNPEVDFFFSDVEEFGDGRGQAFHYRGPAGDLGYSTLQVLGGIRGANVFVGGVTSTICVKRQILERIFPFDPSMLPDWRVRADNVLVFGSSIAGARKYFVSEKTVRYRLHGKNYFAGSKRSRVENTKNVLITERLLGDLAKKVSYGDWAVSGLGVEYRGVPNKNSFLRKSYWCVALKAPMPLFMRIHVMLTMLKSEFV